MTFTGKKVFAWPANNESGHKLLGDYIRPLVAEFGAALELPSGGDDRRRMVRAIRSADAVIIDGSVEDGHVYHKFVELVKTSNNVLLGSRTPLPRNVYAFHQCAPPHGERLSNDQLAKWLRNVLPIVLSVAHSKRGYWEQMSESLREQDQWLSEQTGYFVSYRGSQESQAKELQKIVARKRQIPVRVVPRGQFAYDTECMPRQRMWEVVALLEKEIRTAPGVIMLLSDDYFDSFWTCSELLIMQFHRLLSDHSIKNGLIAETSDLNDLRPLKLGIRDRDVAAPVIGNNDRNEYRRLLRQSDPGTVAPELRRENPGLIGAFFKLIANMTGHAASPRDKSWWQDLVIPCLSCRPKHRSPQEVSWKEHMRLGGYGYSLVSAEQIHDGTKVACQCGASYRLRNKREPRLFWVPGPLGRPWPEEMEVIEQEPIWEIE